jgi:hypothetical protein
MIFDHHHVVIGEKSIIAGHGGIDCQTIDVGSYSDGAWL